MKNPHFRRSLGLLLLVNALGCTNSADLDFHLVETYEHASIDEARIERYGKDQSSWGDAEKAKSLYVPAQGDNVVMLLAADFVSSNPHGETFALERRKRLLLLEVDVNGRVVAGLSSPAPFDEVPHAVSFHFFFGSDVLLEDGMKLSGLPWRGFVSEEFLLETPSGEIFLVE